jgi:preprotein translocase subunit SecA
MEWQDVWDKFTDGVTAVMEAANRGLTAVFGNSNEREIRKMRPTVERINALEPAMQALTDAELKEHTQKLRGRLRDGQTLDDLLPDAFAACREAGRRFLKMRHFDVQLMGGMVLHHGKIAEMVTGEGKTLVATLPAYLNALPGKGVHIVTVNDYLARRDAEWMAPIYYGLGLTVGAIQSHVDTGGYEGVRQNQYRCDITYGTNNEFGFDYLRDNMKPARELQVQRGLNYAIIDEVDSILIDEARTPLIISGPAIDDPAKYRRAHQVAMQLKRDVHFEVKEKEHTCHLTDAGVLEAERLVGVESFYTAGNMEWPHLIDNALKALHLYKRDKDYIVDNGEVIIIDEHTGRKMIGRQWSDGLHQAVEAKENVTVKEETQTLATITFQNFFKLYRKIAGMTGTAMTEANEFYKIYKLDVVAIPTNRSLIRVNYPDVIFCTQKEKWHAVVEEVKRVHHTGRPVLVGTASVEKSEYLSEIFKRHGLKHEVLNAKFVEREADIVAQAGRRGAVTISTNMAGRGTDIILGGNPEAQAWAELKHEYSSRLEVPADVWRATVAKYEEPMRKEGREVVQPRPTTELAKLLKLNDPERQASIVESATDAQRADPEKLARANGIDDVKGLTELVAMYQATRPGGLHIVGTERHESRRIDNQLRGRAGRQGDPGSSRFFLSLEDDLMRIFAGDWVRAILQRLGMKDGEAIESPMVSRRIEAAQKKVEERNFEIRKNLLEYDEIMDFQRKRVYGFRQAILEGADCKSLILEMIDRQIDKAVASLLDPDYGPAVFTVWVGSRLGVEFESREFVRMDFETAHATAKDEALRKAESMIVDLIDDNLAEDVDRTEWNWEAVANAVNRRWGLELKPYDLRRIGRDALGQHLYDHVRKSIEQTRLEGGADFFAPDFGVKNLIAWANQKLATSLSIADVPQVDEQAAETIGEWLQQQAREVYRRKEIEFPVVCGMTRFIADKSASYAARYDRDGLLAWASKRFGAELNPDEFRNLPRQQVFDKLVRLSEDFFRNGDVSREVDQRVSALVGDDGKKTVPAEKLGPLVEWTEQQLAAKLAIETPTVEREDLERQLRLALENRYRPELREVERTLLLQFLDIAWKDHLYAMDHLRSGIGLRGYAQVDPKVEYKREGRKLFEAMWEAVDRRVTDLVFRVEEADVGFVSGIWHITNVSHEAVASPTSPDAGDGIRAQQQSAVESSHSDRKIEPIRRTSKRVGRNDPCPCGSGKKYKNCCLSRGGR